jgi:hypothetical protein
MPKPLVRACRPALAGSALLLAAGGCHATDTARTDGSLTNVHVGDMTVAPDAGSPPAMPDGAPAVTGPDHVAALWAVGDSDTVERDSQALAAPSSVWDGSRIELFAGRNEIVAFQLIVRATGAGIGALRAGLPALSRRGGGGAIIYAPPGPDPSDARQRPIQVFAVNYLNVQQASEATWIYVPGSPGAPPRPTGWKPVQLVPENARAGKGGLPLAVRAGETQSLWFEIFTGKDRPAGIYQGAVVVTADGRATRVPIELELLDFTLPEANAVTAMVYYESSQPERYQGRNLDAVYHRFAHRQRIELVDAYDDAGITAAAGRFDGRDFTPAAGYEGPGQAAGNKVVPASFYGPGPGWEDRTTAWQRSDAWMSLLAARVPGAITFLYMPDEPGAAQFPGIRTIAENVHSNPGPGSKLPIFITHGFTSELDGAIDIWCSGPRSYDAAQAGRVKAEGNDWWVYNGGRPAGPALVMDAPVSDAREIGWASFKAGLRGYFYWHAVHWRHNSQKKVGSLDQDVWSNPVTYDQRDADGNGSFANGDGVLLYPGTERLHPEQDRGIEGPIGTIQLANLRRGLQDHLYLTMARQCGLEALVEQSLAAIVPRVFSAAGSTVSFPQEAAPYEAARRALGKALASCPRP